MPNELQEILAQAVEAVKTKDGKVNLAEVARLTGISRQRLRTMSKRNFIIEDTNSRRSDRPTKISGYSQEVDSFLRRGITNSSLIYGSISKMGYNGGLTTVKRYIDSHRELVPSPRILATEAQNRGRRYETAPGDMFQMDWGFVRVLSDDGDEWRCACFAMVCHQCGLRYIEFFPSARQENLFIGMIHGFCAMGVPRKVYTDNMKSVVVRRLMDGTPVWNKDYDAFQKLVGFKTVLHKISHPWSKGAIERVVRYMKDNFIQGRKFSNISDLNREATDWCHEKNSQASRGRDMTPLETHYRLETFGRLPEMKTIMPYLAPLRKISYDGYVNYEDRLYGVPMSFSGKTVRVQRTGEILRILAPDTFDVIYTHQVNWSRKPNNCIGQWSTEPEEKPTQKVTSVMRFEPPRDPSKRFERFSILSKGGRDDD